MIEFRGVHKTYDNGTKALRDVNINIEKGEFVFIVGSSGAGKSTFLKLIMREEVPNAGEVIVNGYKLSRLKRREIPYLRRTMGIVFQDFRLIPTMTVFDNVAFAMRVTGATKREIRKRVPYILGLVGLQNKARNFPQELSGGEQQRVSLARALVNNPSLIIADEPTGNIDPEMSYEIMELLTEINRRGTTILVVTHEHDLVQAFQRRVIVIDSGTVVSDVKQADDYEAPVPAENSVVADVLDTIQDEPVAMPSFEPTVEPTSTVDAVLADIIGDQAENGGDVQ
ncbi:MAG: cell division ATP-binding protein FtsE [Clostridia bacterium]|nr:cell division ATP-binding protein FtsE [Clostridia bacterium]